MEVEQLWSEEAIQSLYCQPLRPTTEKARWKVSEIVRKAPFTSKRVCKFTVRNLSALEFAEVHQD